MRTFELHRDKDATGVSGTGIVADGVEFPDGTVVVRWRGETPTTAMHESMESVKRIHLHEGKTRIVYTGDPFDRGWSDAAQDSCENCPFASVGGLDERHSMAAPAYITPVEHKSYLRGYSAAARQIYGADWQTCSFGWEPAVVIGAPS